MKSRKPICLILFSLIVLLPAATRAQEPLPVPDYSFSQENPVSPVKGPITGIVLPPPGEELDGPILVRLETHTGYLVTQVPTKLSGRFEFYSVACGTYVLAVDLAGYYPIRKTVDHSYEPAEGIMLRLIPDESKAAARSSTTVSVKSLRVPAPARQEYEKGMTAAAESKWEKAARHFEKATEIFSGYEEAFEQLARVHLQRQKYAEARHAAEQALQLNDNNAQVHALRGVALREEGKREEAAAALRRSLELEEASWYAQLELGRTLLAVWRLGDAHNHLVRAHELNSAAPVVHLNLYNAHVLRSDFRAAVAELDEFLQLFPNHPQAEAARRQRQALLADLARRQP